MNCKVDEILKSLGGVKLKTSQKSLEGRTIALEKETALPLIEIKFLEIKSSSKNNNLDNYKEIDIAYSNEKDIQYYNESKKDHSLQVLKEALKQKNVYIMPKEFNTDAYIDDAINQD